MDNLKRIGLYGVSGTGKTTILKEVSKLTSNVIWLEGSQLVINAAGLTLEQFKKLSDTEKYFYREKAIEKAFEIQTKEGKHLIIDGHLVFAKGESEFENVMTEKDKAFYTDYIYLNFPTETILQRQQNDTDKKRKYSAKTISNWVSFELQELKQFCNKHNLNLHILQTTDNKECVEFISNYITT
jgi:adenylate kinase